MEYKTDFLSEKTENENKIEIIKWYKKWWGKVLIVGLIFGLASLTWFAYVVISVVSKVQKNEFDPRFVNAASAEPPYDISQIVDRGDPVLGESRAKVTIVEFGDFLCPQCQKSYTVMRELATKYPEDIKIVWKNLPILDLLSVDLAQGGECANFQGKFWSYHDRVFSNQEEMMAIDNIYEVAAQIGLDEDVFRRCMDNDGVFLKISDDLAKADLIEAKGTPTFIINGYKISGSVPLEVWDDIIGQLINSEKVN